MKKQRKLFVLRSAISLLLCFFVIFSAFCFVSCSDEETKSDVAPNEEKETEECRKVVRIRKGVICGREITMENLELVEVPVSGIPDGAINSVEAIVGKYAAIDIVVGEYVFEKMISTEAPAEESVPAVYITVRDSIDVSDSADITADLQALIDNNPGRTVYFNDGVYNISSTVYLPTDKEKAVSLRFSNYATLKATANWSGDGAMIAIGAKNEAGSAEFAANTVHGGVIDGAGIAKVGLSIENSSNTFVSNVTVKGADTAVWVKPTANAVNIEGLTVNGTAKATSVGILNEGVDGVFSTTRISNVGIGVKNLGASNEFRNVSAFAGTANGATYAFYEAGDNDVFNFCTAENFACGYYIKDKVKSVIEASSILWTSASVAKQTAFEADGVFNAILVGCKIRFFDATSENSCIKYKAIGSGALRTPIFDETLCDDASYKNVLAGTVVTVK